MAKLPPFLNDKTLESYTHLKSPVNLDFEPGLVQLTKSNAVNKGDVKKDIVTITKQGLYNIHTYFIIIIIITCFMTLCLCAGSSIITTTSSVVTIVDDVSMVKPYSCLAGLVALNKNGVTDENLDNIHRAMLKVSTQNPPTFN